MDNSIFQTVSNFGFASLCCFYLLTRVTRAIDENTKVLKELEILLRSDLK